MTPSRLSRPANWATFCTRSGLTTPPGIESDDRRVTLSRSSSVSDRPRRRNVSTATSPGTSADLVRPTDGRHRGCGFGWNPATVSPYDGQRGPAGHVLAPPVPKTKEQMDRKMVVLIALLTVAFFIGALFLLTALVPNGG
jgi:hypothetical protein